MPEFLRRRWLGVPAWGWGGITVAALGLYVYRKRRAASSANAQTQGTVVGSAAIDPATGVPYSTELAQASTSAQTAPPGASVTLPSGASYSGPASGLDQVLSQLNPPAAPAAPTPPPPAAAPPTPPTPLNSNAFPMSVATGVTQTGTGGPGGVYAGAPILAGAPAYAFLGGQWVQGYNPQTLPAGTPIGTLAALGPQYVGPGAISGISQGMARRAA